MNLSQIYAALEVILAQAASARAEIAEVAPTQFDRDAESVLAGLKDPRASDDLAQMAAVLAAEGYAWVHPLDGSPKRLERVARPADDVRAILEGAARGQFPLGSAGETGSEAIMPLDTDQEGRLGVRGS